MPIRILAKDINHLTDARYFAAWRAEWMCYNPKSLSIEEILAIREWVEGPKHLIDLSALTMKEAQTMIDMEGIDGVFIDSIEKYNGLRATIPTSKVVIIAGDHSPIDGTISLIQAKDDQPIDAAAIYEYTGSCEAVIEALQTQKPTAIALSGGLEEEVGLKSFDQLDEILEWMEESNI